MKFNPFNISFYEKQKSGNELVICKQQENITDKTVALISFTPTKSLYINVKTFNVGDIFYWKEKNRYYMFSLFKEKTIAKGISSFGFYPLIPKSGLHSDIKEYNPNYFSPFSSFESEKNYRNDELITLEYVGNMVLHEDILNLFKKHSQNEKFSLKLLLNDFKVKSDFYEMNFVFFINYNKAYLSFNPTDEESLSNNFDLLTTEQLWTIQQIGWDIYITSKISFFPLNNTLPIPESEKHTSSQLFQGFTSSCFIGDYNESKLFGVITTETTIDSYVESSYEALFTFKNFFLFINEDGFVMMMSVKDSSIIEPIKFLKFVLHPNGKMFEQIKLFGENHNKKKEKMYTEQLLKII